MNVSSGSAGNVDFATLLSSMLSKFSSLSSGQVTGGASGGLG